MADTDEDEEAVAYPTTLTLELERAALRNRRTVLLLDSVSDASARHVAEDLMMLMGKGKSPINLIISTDGGNTLATLTIIAAIRLVQRSGVSVHGHVIGRALSAGFIILQACDKRVMEATDFLMVHGSWGASFGDFKDKEATLKFEKTIRDQIAALVASRNTSDTPKYREAKWWQKLMSDDTPIFLTAAQAKEWGLIDAVNS